MGALTREALVPIGSGPNSGRAILPRVSVLQNVDEGRCLLPLEEVDNPHRVVEEGKARIHGAQLAACSTYALALPAPSQQIHRPIGGYRSGKEQRADGRDGLWQPLIECSRRRVWQLERVLLLEAVEDRAGDATAAGIPVDVGVAPYSVPCRQGSPKDSQPNAPKQFQNM